MTSGKFNYPSRGVPAPVPTKSQLKLRAHYRSMARWTLQGWLTMFYLGAGYAKLNESPELLGVLLIWPSHVDPFVVRALGGLELFMALGFILTLSPAVPARLILRWALTISMLESLVFLLLHAIERDISHALVNVLLFTGSAIVFRVRKV